MTEFLSTNKVQTNFALALLLFAAFALACGGSRSSAPKNPIPAAYQGSWTGGDGSTLQISGDSIGEWKTPGKEVNGAAVEVDDGAKTLKMTLLGFEVKSFKIDKAPAGNSMTLDGTVYRKDGAMSSSSSDEGGDDGDDGDDTTANRRTVTGAPTSETSSDPNVPANGELQSLVKDTMADFDQSIKADDFSILRDNASTFFKSQFSLAKTQDTFKEFVTQKVDLSDTQSATPIISPAPFIEKQPAGKVLHINGSYPTTPTVSFQLEYFKESGEYKLLSIRVKVR